MFDSMGSILEALSPEQQIACSTQNNILLTACPGSGKTRTLTHRLAYQVLRDPASKKIKIAITYTNRAAEEITNRLEGMNIDQSSIWAGTIHQFCMHFIIRPYAMYSKRLCKGYRIIDDYSKKAYGREIAERLGMHLNYYDDPFQYENVRTEYKRVLKEKKEIDFDAILLISEELLASCAFIGSNIASVISSILVDEFQDTNELQYSILSGGLTVAIIILPTIIRSTEEALKTVPSTYREASLGLGATKFQTLYKVVLPSAIPGILSGVILSIGRVIGESAAILLTAGTVAKMPLTVFDSARTLTVHAYLLTKETGDIQTACGVGIVLIVIVFSLNTIAKLVAKKLNKEVTEIWYLE